MFYLLMKATSSSVIRWPSLVAWELGRHKKLLKSIHQWIKPSSVEYLLIGTLTYSFTHLITSYAYNQSETSSINIKIWSMSCIDIIIKGLDYLKTWHRTRWKSHIMSLFKSETWFPGFTLFKSPKLPTVLISWTRRATCKCHTS